MEVALFDFCETLVDFQTADAFVDYVREHIHTRSILRREFFSQIIRKTRLICYIDSLTNYKYSIEKRIKLWQLRGLKETIIEDLARGYYEERIKPHLIPVTNKILDEHQKAGHEVWIVSGGYSIYLKHFAKERKVFLVSSVINFKNGICTGRLGGVDCMNKNKITLLQNNLKRYDNNYTIIASYSDSLSDIPILSVAKEGYVVSREARKWALDNSFKMIIW